MLMWLAHYNDGSTLSQYNADGTENLYANIDRSRLVRFCLRNPELKTVLDISIKAGRRLVFRRRKAMRLTGELISTIHIAGYQYNDEAGKNHKFICYVHEDGRVEVDDDRNDIKYLPEEN